MVTRIHLTQQVKIEHALREARCHSTSSGFAIAYAAAGVRAVTCVPGGIQFNAGYGRRKETLIVADPDVFVNTDAPVDLQSVERILSPIDLKLRGSKSTKRKEYFLTQIDDTLFDAKKRYNELTYPVNRMKKEGWEFCVLTQCDRPAVVKLWDAWCDMKLSSPKLHKISFTAARYLRCFDVAAAGEFPARIYGLKRDGVLAAFRVLSVPGSRCFDLAFCSDRLLPLAARSMQVQSLRDMFASGVSEVNFGESTGKGLSYWKEILGAKQLISWQLDKVV